MDELDQFNNPDAFWTYEDLSLEELVAHKSHIMRCYDLWTIQEAHDHFDEEIARVDRAITKRKEEAKHLKKK